MASPAFTPAAFRAELQGNILPFWMQQVPDPQYGGFYGAVSNDLRILNDVERSAVVCARILWTFSTAWRIYSQEDYRQTAQRAFEELSQRFWDHDFGGVYWSIDKLGQPVFDRKHTYAQAFAIYGLSEYYRACGEAEALRLAQELFRLIETHTFDAVNQGNLECRARDWQPLADMRLSPKDMNCAKSMNTLLHLIEAYTSLLRVWKDAQLETKQRNLIAAFLTHVVDAQTHHLRLFFDLQWHSLADEVSYGHDIEASWLLVEAAEVLGDAALLAQTRAIALKMAQAVYAEGLSNDGSLVYERTAHGLQEDRHWWVQAEAVVGFENAFQLSAQAHFRLAAQRSWAYINEKFVDRQFGDWYKVINKDGVPYQDHPKAGPWECPYHHSRLCFEMIHRLGTE